MMNKMRKMFKSEEGFTLIELLVVLLVLGILASVAVPRFMDMKGKATLVKAKTELKQVQTALELYYAEHGEYPADTDTIDTVLDDYVEIADLAGYTFGAFDSTDGTSYTLPVTFAGGSLTITRNSIE